ncbi:Putative tetratricopeptide-like helical domain superfamily, pentacotripeptide-repeat region of PRORP [Septoria linicola]|uniref:Tetratricopeptide-like helical domain superfamily, pentacotripeptide-repeat region of PRORP n=1 Tax=Septoria linicola TaxID=215465 RepID=A0A9Q9EFT5_9PEZI|nr:Putative tetratricopeptide-like helical domain superfamily, pentacotripeptide-repeat region of PRORP [Septoria linicola]
MKRDDTQRRVAGREHPDTASPATEGVFLDFLYPPQALAYLDRVSRHNLESWPTGHARKSRDHFMQTSRRYSSKPTPRPVSSQNVEQKNAAQTGAADASIHPLAGDEGFLAQDILGETEDGHDRSDSYVRSAASQRAESAEFIKELVPRKSQGASSVSAEHPRHEEEADDSTYAHSPGDLAEDSSRYGSNSGRAGYSNTLISDGPAERMRHLRHILALGTRSISTQHIRQAWRLYLSLPEPDKRDIRLKEKLLNWLNSREDELADAYIISLYWSIPLQERQLATYSTVAKSFARRAAWDLLFPMHREALTNISNGQELSLQIFVTGLTSCSWSIVRRVIDDQTRVFRAAGQEQRMELFWVKVNEVSDLLDRVSALMRGTGSRPASKPTVKQRRKEFRNMASRLSREAVQQTVDGLLVRKLSVQRADQLFSLLNLIVQLDTEAHTFFHKLLTVLIPALGQHRSSHHHPGSDGRRQDAHRVISFLYWHYRQSKVASLHPDLLGIWLEHLTRHMNTTEVERRSERNVTASMVIEDWQQWHGQIGADAVHNLISYSAHTGSVEALRRWTAYLARRYPAYSEEQKTFWAQIYVHTRLADLPAAKKAFWDVSRSARAHGDRLDLKCWQVLLHAYQSVDDLEGGLDAFKELVQTTKIPLDRSAFNPLLNMLARRGDVDGIEDLLRQSNALTRGEPMMTISAQMHIMALTLTDDMPRAESVLAETLAKLRSGEIVGSMTECFNTMLAKYASMRDLDATMRTYRRMKQERIYVNGTTFRHLMQVLANFRRTSAAWAILTETMKVSGSEPTAAHYTVAMIGFKNQNEPEKAIMAHQHMLKHNVRQSLQTKEAFIEAEALLGKRTHDSTRNAGDTVPRLLRIALSDLQETVANIQARDIAHSGGYSAQDVFAPVMWLLGGEKHTETVKQLFRESKAVAEKQSQSPWPTMRLTTNLMNALYHSKEYSEVEHYWKLVKQQADATAVSTMLPDFVSLREQSSETNASTKSTDRHKASHHADDRAEVGFVTSHQPAVQHLQDALPADSSRLLGPRPAAARRHILARPFRIYLASLAARNRVEDALNEATRLLTQGYTFDNITWNRLVEHIAGSDPPLTLLAFTLAERYLIRSFPGWVRRSSQRFRPRKSAIRFNLQYIRARYLGQTELMPQYRTFVWLAKALLDLRKREAVGWQGDAQGNKLAPNIERFLGTIKQIREKAPRTLRAVETMPKIEDKWQNRLLRGIGWKFPPRSDQLQTIADATLLEEANVVDTKLSGAGTDTKNDAPTADASDAGKEGSDESTFESRASARDFAAHEEFDAEEKDDIGPMVDPAADMASDANDESSSKSSGRSQ